MNLSFLQLGLSLKGLLLLEGQGIAGNMKAFALYSIWEYSLLLDMQCGATLSSGYALLFSSCFGFNCFYGNQSF